MRRVLRLLVYAVVAVGLAWMFYALPGRISAEFGAISVELPTPLAALALLLLGVAIHLLAALWRFPRRFALYGDARRRRQGEAASTGALVALAAADPTNALRQARRARRLLGDTPQALLLTAEAGRLAGREAEATAALQALANRPDAAFLGLRGLLRQAIERADWQAAGEIARRAEAAHPGAAWLREERARLAIRAGNWSEALQFATDPAPKAALAAAASAVEPNADRALEQARQAWRADPALAPAALAYATRLRAAGNERQAQSVIVDSWAIRPHPDLGAFALAGAANPLEAVQVAKKLAAANPGHAESLLLLAGASLAAGLTGEARRQAEAARDGGLRERRVFLLLSRIEQAEGDHPEAASAALRHAAEADPDPVWRCTQCHAPAVSWQAACPACLTPGGLQWGGQQAVAAAPPTGLRRLLPWR